MKQPLTIILLVLCAILGAGWFFQARATAATQARLEAIADEKAQAELELAGFVSQYAEVQDRLVAADSAAEALQNALQASESRRIARTRIITRTEIDTVFVGVEQAASQVVRADIDIEPFSGSITFTPPTQFAMRLICEPRLEQYIVQSASDRLLIGVRALSPRTNVSIEAFDATPYLRREGGTPFWQKIALVGAGALIWELAR